MKRIHVPILLSGFLVLASCSEYMEDFSNARAEFTTELAMNIGSVSLFVNEEIDIALAPFASDMASPVLELMPGEDGILKLIFQQDFGSFQLDPYLKLDTLLNDTLVLPSIPGFYLNGTMEFGFNLESFDSEILEGKSLDSMKLDKGRLIIEFNTYENFFSEFSFSFPGITDSAGEALAFHNFIPEENNNTVEFDLSDRKIQITKKEKGDYFIIALDYYIESMNNANNTVPQLKIKMMDLDLDYAYGHIGIDTIPDINRASMKLSGLFPEDQHIYFDFENPQLTVTTRHSFAVPLMYEVNELSMFYPDESSAGITGFPELFRLQNPGGDFIDVNDENTSTNRELARDPFENIFQIDTSTNIDLLLSNKPDSLVVNGLLIINPEDSDSKSYLRDTDSISAIVDMELPFSMRVVEVAFRDTFSFEPGDPLNNENVKIENLRLKAEVENQFPFNLDLQLYLLDEQLEVVDSVFSASVLISASDNDITGSYTEFFADLDAELIERFPSVRKVAARTSFKTREVDEGQVVSFTRDQQLNIDLSIFSRLNILY